MLLSDRKIAFILFLTSIGAFLLLWLAENNLKLAIGGFVFVNTIAIVVLIKNAITTHGITHAHRAKILRTLGLLPNPTEASILVLTITMLAFFIINDLWKALLSGVDDLDGPFLIAFLSLGILLSLYHAFSKRKKTLFEERVLRTYVLIILAGLSFYTLVYSLESKQLGYFIFVALNGMQLLALLWVMELDEDLETYVALPSREARLIESILAVCVAVIGVLIGHYLIQAHWVVIFSSIILIWNWVQQFLERRSIPRGV